LAPRRTAKTKQPREATRSRSVLWEYTKRMSTPLESIIEGFTNAPPPPIPNTSMDLAKARTACIQHRNQHQ